MKTQQFPLYDLLLLDKQFHPSLHPIHLSLPSQHIPLDSIPEPALTPQPLLSAWYPSLFLAMLSLAFQSLKDPKPIRNSSLRLSSTRSISLTFHTDSWYASLFCADSIFVFYGERSSRHLSTKYMSDTSVSGSLAARVILVATLLVRRLIVQVDLFWCLLEAFPWQPFVLKFPCHAVTHQQSNNRTSEFSSRLRTQRLRSRR